jgi:hypothetical protein
MAATSHITKYSNLTEPYHASRQIWTQEREVFRLEHQFELRGL